jgi:chorismate synthase
MLGNTWGRLFRVTTCGESYGEALQIIVEGVPAGIELSKEDVQSELDRRRPGTSPIDSPREETDQVEIVAGLLEGVTTGAPVGMIIYNVDRQAIHVQQYRDVKDLIRPGHAEYTFFMKYGKYADWCGAGRASGRETAGRVAAGAIARKLLGRENVHVWGYVKECAGIAAREMTLDEIKANYRTNLINCPDEEAAEKMIARILEIKEEGDTCGGIVEIIAEGVPPGLGEPVFNKLSADLAAGLMSIGSVKGVEFGAGFAATKMKGSEHNDIPYLDGNKIRFRTNNAGGLLGGISNGENLVARIAVKPTSTISKDQWTVNMAEMKEQILAAITRRDPTICARIVPVAESMVALTLMDHLMMWRGWQGVARLDNPWLAAWEEQEA